MTQQRVSSGGLERGIAPDGDAERPSAAWPPATDSAWRPSTRHYGHLYLVKDLVIGLDNVEAVIA